MIIGGTASQEGNSFDQHFFPSSNEGMIQVLYPHGQTLIMLLLWLILMLRKKEPSSLMMDMISLVK